MNKTIIGIIVAAVILLAGAVFLLSSTSSDKANLKKTVGTKMETLEEGFDFKDIPYGGGNAIHEFKIKNIGDKELQVANIATSCACSKAYFKSAKGESPKFSMKGMSAPSDWTGTLSPGEEGQMVAVFDPTYHGPQGTGPISRVISFETNDPDRPYVELAFNGNVVN